MPTASGLITLSVVILGAVGVSYFFRPFQNPANPALSKWVTVSFCALAAGVVSAVASSRHNNLLQRTREEVTERERLRSELAHILSSVHCLLWHANVKYVDNDYIWDMQVSYEEAARKFLSIQPDSEDFVDAWYQSKLPDDRLECDQRSTDAFESGETEYSNEYRCVAASGEIRWYYEDVQIEHLGNREYHVIGVVVDITQLKRTEQKLNEERVMLRTLIDNVPDLVFAKDVESRFTLDNYAHMSHLRFSSQDEMSGKTDWDVFPPEIAKAFYDDEQEIVRTGQPLLNRTERSIDGDGNEHWFWTTKVPYRDAEGKVIGIVGVSRDITERRREENALKLALQEIDEARLLAEHHAELLETQAKELAEARDLALDSTRAKSEFLANMSHEIRTPMNGILGIAELMLGTKLTAEQYDFACTIRSSADALLTVINDILDFSRIEAGKLEVEVTEFNLRSVMEEVTDLVAGNAYRKHLELACLLPHSVPERLMGDPARLRQVLTNLMGNAVKFTEHGEIRLEAHLLEETNEDAAIRISVVDTGIGIPQSAQARIFESFTQADGSTTRKYGGTGLGLTISRHLTELMGGQIGMTSEVGKGSTFYVENRYRKQTGQATYEATLAPELMNGLRVLIVDDNTTNRKVLHEQLASWGCDPHEAECGLEGIQLLRTSANEGKPYQVAILDMQMPDMDGEETARHIREIETYQHLPLILYTSIGEHSKSEQTRSFGFVSVLAKPARQSQLFNVMLAVLGEAKMQGAIQPSDGEDQPKLSLDVLLAEDNVINQMVANMMLERFGCRGFTVENGALAVAEAKKTHYDVILMDVHMPDMDGYTATAEIRQFEAERGVKTPIIGMTAKAMPGDREAALSAGMDDYLIKPVRPNELYEMLRRWGAV